MTTSSEVLKPCPFCGGEATCSPCDDSGEVVYGVACMSCQAQITKCDEAGAIEQWNTRTASRPSPTEAREARWAKWPFGDAGDAIDWACDHIDDKLECHTFLEAWRTGNLSEWSDYLEWAAFQRKCATE